MQEEVAVITSFIHYAGTLEWRSHLTTCSLRHLNGGEACFRSLLICRIVLAVGDAVQLGLNHIMQVTSYR